MMDQATALREMVSRAPQAAGRARVITVTSGKGGVGKSSIAVNLAIALSRLGNRVVILDADFGLANVEVMMGVRPQYNLADLMFRGRSLADIITTGPENIGFISGGSGIQEMTNLTREQLINLSGRLVELDAMSDIIIVDTGAGISDAVMEFVMASSEILLVATPEPTSITDAYALLKTLNKKKEFVKEHSVIKLIANRVSGEEEGSELYDKLNVVVDKFLDISLQYLGSVPQDQNLIKAVMMQKPFSIAFPGCPASKAVNGMAAKLMGSEEAEKATKRSGLAGIFAAVIGRKATSGGRK